MYIFLALLVFLLISFCVGYAILWIFGSSLVRGNKKQVNPYIQAHIYRKQNDENYEEYLKWMDKNGYSLPIDKIKTPEEIRFEKEYKKALD